MFLQAEHGHSVDITREQTYRKRHARQQILQLKCAPTHRRYKYARQYTAFLLTSCAAPLRQRLYLFDALPVSDDTVRQEALVRRSKRLKIQVVSHTKPTPKHQRGHQAARSGMRNALKTPRRALGLHDRPKRAAVTATQRDGNKKH